MRPGVNSTEPGGWLRLGLSEAYGFSGKNLFRLRSSNLGSVLLASLAPYFFRFILRFAIAADLGSGSGHTEQRDEGLIDCLSIWSLAFD